MPIQFNCTHCNRAIQTPDETAGKKCRCPDCGEIMPIPSGESTGQESPYSDSQSPFRSASTQPSSPISDNPYSAPPSPTSSSNEPPLGHQQYHLSDRGPIILVFGITSIFTSLVGCACCILSPVGLGLGIPAWIMGKNNLNDIRLGRRDPSQQGLSQAGMICGIVGVVLAVLSLVLNVLAMVFQFAAIGMKEF